MPPPEPVAALFRLNVALVTVPAPDRGVVETAAGAAAVAREGDDRDREAAAVENAAAGAGRGVSARR